VPVFEEEMPFSGIREAKQRLDMLKERRARLNEELRELLKEFSECYPYETTPVRLSRSTDKSLTALRWRVVSYGGGLYKKERDTLGRRIRNVGELVELHQPAGQAFLEQLSPQARKVFLDFEYRRIHLNYLFAVTVYEIGRLEHFIEMFDAWRKMKKKM